MGLLYIGTLCFAKLSNIILLHFISPENRHRKVGLALGVFIAFWSFLSLFVAVFQCRPPDVWKSVDGHCYNRVRDSIQEDYL